MTSAIAQRLNWPADKTDVLELKLQGIAGCEIYDAYDTRVLDGVSVAVARLREGGLIVDTEPEAVDKVLARCVSPATPAATLAVLLVSFSNYAGLRVLQDNSLGIGRSLLQKAGRDFAAPQITLEHGERVLRFLALSPEGSRLYQVRGHLGNRVRIEVEQL